MDSVEDDYAAFEETVKRTVYVDNLSPQVTEAVHQFGNVEKVQFIPNFTQLRTTSPCAQVEMQNPKQANAEQIAEEMSNVPFMMAGMPRPVCACMDEKEMFDESPRKPGRRIMFDQNDLDFQIAEAAFKETCS